jgi:hypothetical protein
LEKIGRKALKQILWCSVIIGLLLCLGACSKTGIVNVLDDITRDTYENNMKRQQIENLDDPAYEKPPTYDQYQRERKE